jgi:hypothetical protein
VDPRAGLGDMDRENSGPYRDSNSDSSVIQIVSSRYTDYAIPAVIIYYMFWRPQNKINSDEERLIMFRHEDMNPHVTHIRTTERVTTHCI